MKTLYSTRAAAQREAERMAARAGVEGGIRLATTRAQIEALQPGLLAHRRRSVCSGSDPYLGRAWTSLKLIWVRLPVDRETLAHEVQHLRPGSSTHRAQGYQAGVVALYRGLDPRKVQAQPYLVTITSTQVWRVTEFTAAAAKKNYQRGERLSSAERRVATMKIK